MVSDHEVNLSFIFYHKSSNLFSFKINYDQVENPVGNVKSLYNGNISETYWRTASSNIKRSYGYEYDNLNRLTNAIYLKSDAQTDAYNEALTYDAIGNILTLARNGNYDSMPVTVEIDKLNYTYDSYNVNRLIKVTDLTNSPLGFSDGANNANEYDYDGHGNMIRDDNKGITSILYNHLNLPTQITFSGTTTRKIQYLYNAVGAKQKKVVTDGTVITTTDYLTGFQYTNNVLEFFPHAEGYVKFTEGYFNYVFNYTDHLGNVRLSYAQDPKGGATRIMEENHYYPFGLKHTNYDNGTQRFMRAIGGGGDVPVFIAPDIFGSSAFKYKYNGKEYQDELGLNVTAMDYRQYDSAIGRFNSMDKLSELTYDISPYRFALNNPIFWADPTGLSEQNGGNLAICPTCPNTPAFKPLIDDPNNTYVYDPETKTATQVIELEEVVVQGKPKAKTATDYYGALEFNYNGLNDVLLGVGATGLKNSYNSNYGKFNSVYYNFYKAMGKSSRLPKPGAQRQLLKKLLSNSKFSASSKLLRRAGIAGAVLTVGNVGLDVAEDGAIKASSIIDGGSLAVLGVATVFCPPCAVAIGAGLLVYGVLDYTFEINDAIDENTEQIQIFDK